MSKLNSTMFDGVNRIDRTDVIKFRCNVCSLKTSDVHREFTGCYFPRWHALYLEEARMIHGSVKLVAAYPFDTYVKENGDHFVVSDFVVGNKIEIAVAPTNQRDDAARTFVITQSDVSRLYAAPLVQLASFSPNNTSGTGAALSLPSSVVNEISAIRDAFIRQAGGVAELGIKAVGKRFRTPSADGRRVVTRSDFGKLLNDAGVVLEQNRIDAIFASFSLTAAGAIPFDDMLEVIRGPMNEERKKVVQDVFRHLDYDGDGCITINEIAAKFAASKHPEVLAGSFTAQQLLKGFLTTWDATDGAGKVSFAEFMDYYCGVSASIQDDALFAAVVRSAWKLF